MRPPSPQSETSRTYISAVDLSEWNYQRMNPVPKRLEHQEQRVEDRSYRLDRLGDFREDLEVLLVRPRRVLDRDSLERRQDLLEVDSGSAGVGLAVHRGYLLLPYLLLDLELDLDPEQRRQG
jgi:hypothetical protein